jgi:tetratricopeptide (TPR) repeat protein
MRIIFKIAPIAFAALLFSACQSPQAKEARNLDKGKKAFAKKDFETAIIHFKNAMAAQPKDAEPYYQLGLSYLAEGDFRSAASYLRKATERNPKHAGAQLKLSELMAATSSQDMVLEAQKRTQGVLDLQPDNIEALNLLALTDLRLGKPENAEKLLEQALQKAPTSLQSSVALARTRLARRDVVGAEAALKDAVARSPKSADAVVHLGSFYQALGKTAEAEQQFRHALEIDPKHGPALIALGAMQVRAGQSDQAEQTYRRLSALPEKQYKPLHALFLFQSGKRSEAVAEMEKLAQADQSDRDARTRLVRAYLAVNRIPDAEKVLTVALKKNSVDADALLQRSRIYLGSGKYDQAESDLNQVLRFRNSPEVHYLLSKLQQARGKNAMRTQELGQALQLDPRFAAARVELAQALIADHGAESALKTLDEAPQDQKNTVSILVERNWALLALGRKDDARKGVDQILAVGRVPDAFLQDAALKLDRQDFSGARTAAEEVLKLNPDDVRALNLLVQTYAAEKQLLAGVRRVREYAAGRPASPKIQEFLGQLLASSGDRAGARQAFEAALAANSALVAPNLALAQLDLAEGQMGSARSRLSAVVAAHPESLPGHFLLAQLEMTDGKPAAAIDQYRKVLALDDKNPGALNNLAFLLAENNQADEALQYAQEAKEIDPNSPAVDDTLGWTYYRKGMYTMAVTYLQSAAAKDGTARRRYHLAMAYLKNGDMKRGRESFDAAYKLDPNLPEAATARQLVGTASR